MPVAAERKALFARRDLVDKLLSIASKRGYSLYSLVNEIFEAYIKLAEVGVPLEALREELLAYNRLLSAGFAVIPREPLLEALREKCGEEGFSKSMFEAGLRISKYYASLNAGGGLSLLLRDAERALSWIGEVSFEVKGEKVVKATIASTAAPQNCARAFLELVRGILEAQGFKQVELVEAGALAIAVFEKQGGGSSG
ncbi:MAG: hypothetical protein ACP5KA_05680 [Desulfurococcaceae archaeon]